MTRTWSLCLASLLALVLAAPARSETAAVASSSRLAMPQALAEACPSCKLLSLERRPLTATVAEYSFPVRVGPGPYDVIRLHRVVKESAPFVPIRSSRAVFLAHGDIWGFDAAFLTSAASAAVADDHAFPVFLAQAGVDVWGIDFRWTLVPIGTSDFSFMAGWDLETDAHDLGAGLAVARATRALTGSGLGKLFLLGWSRGGQVGYAYLDGESQLPSALRQVRGFIPVDILLKTDAPVVQAAACTRLALTQGRLSAGEIADATGTVVTSLGLLAKAAPGDPSHIVPGLSNRQAALLAGEATFLLQPPGGANVPDYHFNGGTFDGNGLPAGLVYSDEAGFLDFFTGAAPFEPLQVLADGDIAVCDGPDDLPFDDHLAEIEVPVLYVGAGGGFGDFGVYTTTLLGGTDVSALIVSLVPPALRLLDIGHADIFSADDAPSLFWQPMLDWVLTH